jgi:hypothetical protein
LHLLPHHKGPHIAGPQVAFVGRLRWRGVRAVVFDLLQAPSGQCGIKLGVSIGVVIGLVGAGDVELATRLQARDLG